MDKQLEICEVAPRDGLQSASQVLSVSERITFIERLIACGLTKIEVGSLVNPKLVPTMADSDQVFSEILRKHPQLKNQISLLVPNQRGLDRAAEIGCKSVALFSATSETFNKKNINRGVQESIAELGFLIAAARRERMVIRLYISTVFDCAYQGTMHPVEDLKAFLPLFESVDEISLGDTTGRATKAQLEELLASGLLSPFREKLWWHFHDTFQLAGENAHYCMEQGFVKFDSSAGGIGGCPFSPGAKGNIATEKVIAIAEQLGFNHTIDARKLVGLPVN
jgi:hydroxymethylglutaryl-CoA lyase